jgi:hypothetical protein
MSLITSYAALYDVTLLNAAGGHPIGAIDDRHTLVIDANFVNTHVSTLVFVIQRVDGGNLSRPPGDVVS